MKRNWTKIDAADELRRIGPQVAAAVRELERLCERLPMELLVRVEIAAPEITEVDLAKLGPKLTALGERLQSEINAMPDDEYEAMMEQVEERRRLTRSRVSFGLIHGTPPALTSDDNQPEETP